MKKILLASALLAATLQAGIAQTKSEAAIRQSIESAREAAANPKKNTKVATWLKLAQAYSDAYQFSKGNGWTGASQQEMQLLSQEKPIAVEDVVLQGQQYRKEVYPTHNYYFNANGVLQIIEVTKFIDDVDPLQLALEAYAGGAAVDAGGSKTKEMVAGIEAINNNYIDAAYADYTTGNFSNGSLNFEKAAKALASVPCSKIDSASIYNAGFLAWLGKDYARARDFFARSLEIGYYAEDGEAYAKLADTYGNLSQPENQKSLLEEGFTRFPQSQSILVGLINYYISSGDKSNRIFELLDEAKKNEPTNASLYYVEGNIHEKLGEYEAAEAAYSRCSEINPEYEYGYIGAGVMFYNKALKLQNAANEEMDNAKFDALIAEFNAALKACVPCFEKAFEVTKDNDIKGSVAEYLKNACFRFRDEPEYQALYDKYSQFVANSGK
ncbi:MAG: hypothetical protein MJY44_03385 [Bacteroidales bacterium]|nr:hypothetical protein [Bacteroidales bacterium]